MSLPAVRQLSDCADVASTAANGCASSNGSQGFDRMDACCWHLADVAELERLPETGRSLDCAETQVQPLPIESGSRSTSGSKRA